MTLKEHKRGKKGQPEDRLIGPDREARLKAKKRFAKAVIFILGDLVCNAH